jgi:pyruvate/2-oxoglutarate dehydrogenase complex dihydrolipoamide acyltransferase (E2) component
VISDVGEIYYERLVLPSLSDRFWTDDRMLRLLRQSALKIYLEARAPPPLELVSQYAITLVYVDPVGDKIYIGSDLDLMNAVIPHRCDMDETYCPPDSTTPAAKFLAKVRPISTAENSPAPPSAASVAAGTQTAPAPPVRPPPSVEDVIEAVMGIVGPAVRLSVQAVERAASQVAEAHAAAAAVTASKPSRRTIPDNAKASPPTAAATATPESGRPFIHMSHTCDECLTCPIVGERYHCMDKDDYDLCQSCYSKYDWPLRFQPVKLGTLAPHLFFRAKEYDEIALTPIRFRLLRSRHRPPGACAEAT